HQQALSIIQHKGCNHFITHPALTLFIIQQPCMFVVEMSLHCYTLVVRQFIETGCSQCNRWLCLQMSVTIFQFTFFCCATPLPDAEADQNRQGYQRKQGDIAIERHNEAWLLCGFIDRVHVYLNLAVAYITIFYGLHGNCYVVKNNYSGAVYRNPGQSQWRPGVPAERCQCSSIQANLICPGHSHHTGSADDAVYLLWFLQSHPAQSGAVGPSDLIFRQGPETLAGKTYPKI